MNKKTILFALVGCTAAAMAGVAIISTPTNYMIKADTESKERFIRFDNASDVITKAGSKIGLEIKEGRESYVTLYENERISDMDRYGWIQVISRDSDSLAVFANITSIDICYKAPGTDSDALDIWLGNATVGDFTHNMNDYKYLPGTEGLYSTFTYTPENNLGKNALVALYSNIDGVEIGWMQINYTC